MERQKDIGRNWAWKMLVKQGKKDKIEKGRNKVGIKGGERPRRTGNGSR